MKRKTFSIGSQFIFGIILVIALILFLANETYQKFSDINHNVELLYNHSFKVRRAVGELQVNFQIMRVHTRDIMLAKTEKEINEANAAIEFKAKQSERLFDELKLYYTGDESDVERAYEAFVNWNTTRQKNLQLAKVGEVGRFMDSVSPTGEVGVLRNKMIDEVNNISENSNKLSEQRFQNSQKIKANVVANFVVLISIIIAVVLLIAYFLFKNVQTPIKEMITTINDYKNGHNNIRNSETVTTELNVLSQTFNELFDYFEEEKILQQNYSQLSTLMLSEINAHKFFNNLLSYLCQTLMTQVGGVYVLSRDKSHYYLYESVGMKMSKIDYKFNAHIREGEFGEVLTTKRISYIKNLPLDTNFIFQTSAGDIVPRELINIPVVIAGEVAAIISLASVRNIDRASEKLLEKSFDVITARVDGVLSYRRMRKLAEELEQKSKALADSSAYNRALIEASIDPMLTINKDGVITDVNHSLSDITGVDRASLIGRAFHSLFVDAQAAKISHKEAFDFGIVVNKENQIIGEHNIPVLFNAATYRNADNEVLGVFVTLRDITETKNREIYLRHLNQTLTENELLITRKNNELSAQSAELGQQNAELEMQKQQLIEANRLKTVFLSNMSHELRTPLNSVIALSGVLGRRLADKIPADEYSYIDVIQRNGKHLLALINDILDLARIESGRDEIELSTFDINDMVSEMHSLISAQASEKDLIFEKILLAEPLQIETDYVKCRHILQNLLGNAIKFTDKGKVSIEIVENENHIAIAVADTGIGIAQENISHIFDEFRQADGSTTRRFGGTGLGLSIAKKYAEALHATLKVESELNKGSIFTLLLPKKFKDGLSEMHVDIKPVAVPIDAQSLRNKTVLLVEDSDPAIVQIKFFLEENNYNVMVARNGAEAIELLHSKVPDAMILDLMMPQMDGFELLELIRNNKSTSAVPVLILTAKHITNDDLKRLKSNNIHQLIQKGDVNKNELLVALANMMGKPKIADTDERHAYCKRNAEMPPRTVLIVEDNPDNLFTVKAILDNNFEIIEAYDGRAAITMAVKHKPDLILMDIALPELDGIHAFKAIRSDARTKKIPVVALTASAMTSERETILSHGFDAYLAKPIDEKEFCKTIKSILYGI